jgi:type VI secretion system protein VasJ
MSLVNEMPSASVAALLKPIDPQVPAGFFDVEDETYQAIDQEMVKLGGLRESTIDWPYIEEASRHYLATQCKQFRILGHLLTAWLRSRQWEQWSDGLNLLAGMIERYWEIAHPKPGPTGYLAKRKQVELMIKRLGEALATLDTASFSAGHLTAAGHAMASLRRCTVAAQLDEEALEELERLLARQGERAAAPSQRIAKVPAERSAGSFTDAFFPGKNEGALGNERETRRALLAMADFANQQDLYDPTGYLLRRFSIWAHIHAAPPTRRERYTELAAVPGDIADGYQEALNSTAIDPALLSRVEKSVAASPFWIRGSFLAAGIASRLAMGEVAEAIRQATERFVRRIPALQTLCFSNGIAFVDEQTSAWLSAAQKDDGSGSPVQEYADLREELVAQLNNEGVEVVLLRLQALQTRYSAPRQRCYATVIAADLLASRGLSWLADDLYAGVCDLMQTTAAQAWEPDLYLKVAQRDGASRLVDQGIKG